ncbi:MAG TPA: diadenylate cyclase [Desulfomonilia bacterium]|nr:diadenylate cyclase [Desulfomonilia bacterium]
MNDAIFSFLESFRLQDFFDIFIITTLIYVILIWFKHTTSRFVFVGMSLLGGIYIGARLFHLYLTTLVLQSFFTVLIIALVVIFQEDIRRFFERLATLRSLGRNHNKSFGENDSAVSAIVESVAEFASKRTGALIVIQGNDPLDRQLTGGYPLDGVVTKALLMSIFDIHSQGHDGAVIISKNRIEKFGCHLPLSTSTERVGDFGLRHTAAMGLSERSDALCIVISEERGTITVARNAEMFVLKNAAELRAFIEKYSQSKQPERATILSGQWFRKNTLEKCLALMLAIGLWFVFGYQKESIQRDYIVPIEYRRISPEWEIEESRVTDATITLMGSSQAFRLFDPNSLKLSIDLSSLAEGRQVVKLSADMVNVPSNLTLVKIKPDRITVTASHLYLRDIKISIETVGNPPEGYELKGLHVDPQYVSVLAPFALTGKKISIATEPIDLKGIKTTQSVQVKLVPSTSKVRFKNNQTPVVNVIVDVTPLETKDLKDQRRK